MVKPLEIVISSAKEDEKFLDMLFKALEGSLRPLKQQGFISLWHERDIKPGAITKQEIQKHLQTARIILLLISADFMSLAFCYSEEMQHLMRRHQAGEIHIIPIILRETDWESAPFGALQPLPGSGQAVNSWGNRDRAFLNITRGIKKIVDGLIPSTSTPLGESEESQSITKRHTGSSSEPTMRKSPSSFTDEQQHTAKEGITPAPSTREQTYAGIVNYWGVLVGVGEYEDTSYSPLHVCVNDVKAVAKQLTQSGYDPGYMRLLVDEGTDKDFLLKELIGENAKVSKPTYVNILAALKTVADRTQPEDLLLFYYTGHGSIEDHESYLVTHTGCRGSLKYTALSLSVLKEIMLKAPAQKKVIILDTCRRETTPGSKGTPQAMPPAFIERVFEQAKGIVILTSCDEGEESYAWEERGQSVITYYLLEALQGGNADFNGKDRISTDDVYAHVYSSVRRWAMKNNRSQTPRRTVNGQGSIVLAYYQQKSIVSDTITPGAHTAIISSPPMAALSWKDIQSLTIQGEKYVFEHIPIYDRPTDDDGATLREAKVRHAGTDLPLWLKQVHIVDTTTRHGMKLQQILKKEYQILMNLENEGHFDFPHVFPLIDSNAEKDFTYAYMLTNDKSLLQAFESSKKPFDKSSINYLLQSVLPLCNALSILHKENLSHRTLSPDTLILFKGRYAMLQNIGLAAWTPKKGENSGWYLAPEQEEKNSDIVAMPGPATDIYQLGTILYFLMTGQIFSPGSLPIFYNQNISSQLNKTIRRAVAHQPIERWSSIEEFSLELRQSM